MKIYGGFVCGKLDWIELDDGWGGTNWRKVPAVFRSRQEARCQYQDVRHVEIKIEAKTKATTKRKATTR